MEGDPHTTSSDNDSNMADDGSNQGDAKDGSMVCFRFCSLSGGPYIKEDGEPLPSSAVQISIGAR